MEALGVKLDLELTMFYQGLESGTGSQDYEFGSRLDGFVKLDTGKMGSGRAAAWSRISSTAAATSPDRSAGRSSRPTRARSSPPTPRRNWWRRPSSSRSGSGSAPP